MLTVFVFVMNVFSLPGVILICCSEFYFAVTVVGHRSKPFSNICQLAASIPIPFEKFHHRLSTFLGVTLCLTNSQ